MAMATTTITMPHPTSDHAVGQWTNNRQEMILNMPLILTKPTPYSIR